MNVIQTHAFWDLFGRLKRTQTRSPLKPLWHAGSEAEAGARPMQKLRGRPASLRFAASGAGISARPRPSGTRSSRRADTERRRYVCDLLPRAYGAMQVITLRQLSRCLSHGGRVMAAHQEHQDASFLRREALHINGLVDTSMSSTAKARSACF
jgi:hypothetical protein